LMEAVCYVIPGEPKTREEIMEMVNYEHRISFTTFLFVLDTLDSTEGPSRLIPGVADILRRRQCSSPPLPHVNQPPQTPYIHRHPTTIQQQEPSLELAPPLPPPPPRHFDEDTSVANESADDNDDDASDDSSGVMVNLGDAESVTTTESSHVPNTNTAGDWVLVPDKTTPPSFPTEVDPRQVDSPDFDFHEVGFPKVSDVESRKAVAHDTEDSHETNEGADSVGSYQGAKSPDSPNFQEVGYPGMSNIESLEEEQGNVRTRAAGAFLRMLETTDQDLTGCIVEKFFEFDLDENGSLSCAELHIGLENMGVHASVAEIMELFQFVETNHHGEIGFDAFADLVSP